MMGLHSHERRIVLLGSQVQVTCSKPQAHMQLAMLNVRMERTWVKYNQYNFFSNKKPNGESALRAAKRADGTDKFLGNKKELFQEIEKQLLNVID
jgi:hypothetical protein